MSCHYQFSEYFLMFLILSRVVHWYIKWNGVL